MKEAILAALISFGALSWGLAEQADLARLKTQYDDAILLIEMEAASSESALLTAYTNDLQVLRSRTQAAGDLDSLTAILAEMARVESEQSLPAAPPDVPELKTLWGPYEQRLQAVKTRRAKRIVALASQYDKALESIQRRLTREGKLDQAIAVQEQRTLLHGTETWRSAQALLESQSKPPPPVPSPSEAVLPLSAARLSLEPVAKVFPPEERGQVFRRFPARKNRARGGTASASSQYQNRNPQNTLSGAREGDSWTLNEGKGWYQVEWPKPVLGRYLIFINRTLNAGEDPWGPAKFFVNGRKILELEESFAGGSVLLIDLGKTIRIEKLKAEIDGSSYPGLAGLEVHESAIK